MAKKQPTWKEKNSDSRHGETQRWQKRTELLGRDGLMSPLSTRRERKDGGDDLTETSLKLYFPMLGLTQATTIYQPCR